ncbi:MAG TPA: protein translocase subunit SecD [Streptosporangiaceae bacterium]|nr:protein translocase subunit SecD [Streptosporangiaceae bacterium]
MAPPTTTSHPGRLLGTLVALIVVLLLGVLGGTLFQPSHWHSRFKVGRGLDISSGTTVTLQAVPPPHTSAAQLQTDMNTAQSIMTSRVNGAGFNGATVTTQGTNLINVTVPEKGVQQVINLVGTTAQLRFRQVLLVASNYATPGATPTPTPSATPTPSPTPTPSSSASPSPSKSSAALGAPGAGSGSGSHGLAVSARPLAGGRAAAAKAKPKASASPSPSPSPSASPSPASGTKLSTTADGTGNASLLTAKTKADFDRLNCANPRWRTEIYGNNPNNWDNPDVQTVTCYQGAKYALDKSLVTGEMLKLGGSSTQLQNNGDWWVNLTFNGTGTKAFGQLSTKMFDNYYDTSTSQPSSELDYFAIVLDGTPVAVPYMAAVLDTGTATIQGTFTQSQADNLANVLNYGALPLTFRPLTEQSVSAQLGSSALQAGLLAGALGLLLVVVYAFLYYRGLGIVAVSSLAIAALISYLSVVLLSLYESFALSLAGIAGLIVAVGITADSFVVFFERLRDEVREGKSLRSAVERGWQRARRTILVSDTVSFIAAAVLYKFAVTDVQNFAFTLGLTTLVDVIVVFLFTKPMITLLARTKFFGGQHRLSGLDPARLGTRSPWRGSRRPAPRPQPGGGAPAAAPRTNPKEA